MSRKLPCLTSVSYLDTHLASLARVLGGDDVACVMRARSQLQHLHKGFCRSGREEDGLKREEEEEGCRIDTTAAIRQTSWSAATATACWLLFQEDAVLC